AGSKGTSRYEGAPVDNSAVGTYEDHWIQPSSTPAPPTPCNPVDPIPGSAGQRHGGARDGKAPHDATVVRGMWTGDLECAPTDVKETDTPGTYKVSCVAGTGYEGAFTGHSVITLTGTIDGDLNTEAAYDETIYATYL